MARSHPNNALLLRVAPGLAATGLVAAALAALVAGGAAAPAVGAVSLDKCSIEVESDGLGANFKQSTTQFKNVEITACDARIVARNAKGTSMDFDDSTWTFDGDVRINMGEPQGSLKADRAIVRFRNNLVQHVTVTGTPAELEQKRTDSNTIMRGKARQMVYEMSSGTVTLSDDASVSEGGNTSVKAGQLVYDIRKQEVVGSGASAGERVRMTIQPRTNTKNDKSQPPPPATPPASNATGGAATPRPQ